MKLNLLVCVRFSLKSYLFLLCSLKICVRIKRIVIFSRISLIVRLMIEVKFLNSSVKLMFVLMVIKNKLSKRLWNGLMLFLSLWWYFEFVSMMFVRNVFSVVDMLMRDIKSVILIMNNSVVVVNSLCSFVMVIKWKIGWVR